MWRQEVNIGFDFLKARGKLRDGAAGLRRQAGVKRPGRFVRMPDDKNARAFARPGRSHRCGETSGHTPAPALISICLSEEHHMPGNSLETLELHLTGMAYGGEAFGREASGRMVFVPFALAGERVRVKVVEGHRSWARAQLTEILDPSSDRIEPRCRHFGACGGCHYQHIAYPRQVEEKASILRAQLQRLGGLSDPRVATPIPSACPWNTRNHIQFDLTPDGALGFHPWGVSPPNESRTVLPITECHLPEAPLNELWPRLTLDPESSIERVALRLGADDESMLVLHSAEPATAEAFIELPASVVWLDPSGVSVLAGSSYLPVEVSGVRFRVAAGSFFQIHTQLAAAMVQHVLSRLAPERTGHVLDLYAGVGLFSAFLAPAAGQVTAIELSPSASDDFRFNLDPYDNVSLYEASVEQALPELEGTFDAILADPPRAGLGQAVITQLTRLAPSQLVYVSCDAATLARDARSLTSAGFSLREITLFDLFPQTFHMETVSVWDRCSP